jgi:hypothetical protein
MKKLYLLSTTLLIAFVFIYSCSTEEEDNTPPPSVVATPEPEPPAPTQYTLTVTAGEGGTVSTEGGTYDEGTEVTITATPNDGYEFVGWEGSDSDSSSLTITLNGNFSVQALFSASLNFFELQQNFINIPNGTATYMENIVSQMMGSSIPGSFTYDINGEIYLFVSGTACSEGECEGVYNILDVPPNPYLVFKKNDEGWELHDVLDEVSTWAIRNFQFRNEFLVISGANEEGATPAQWIDNAYMGELQGNEIQWKKVNNQNDMAFMHDVGIGDFNFDGLMDVITGPGRDLSDPDRCRGVDCNPPGDEYIYNFYFQQNDGSFELQSANSVIEYPNDSDLHRDFNDDSQNFGAGYFSLEVIDLDGDGIDEIIAASFWTVVFKYSPDIGKYRMHWYTNHNYDFGNDYTPGDFNGFTVEGITAIDLNNDGNLDIALDSSAGNNQGQNLIVYLGNGDGTFQPGSLKLKNILPGYQPTFMDINNDNHPDILFKANDGYFTSDGLTTNPYRDSKAPDYLTGVILNNLIWINDGAGGFNQYNDKILFIPNVQSRQIQPYFEGGKIHFVGFRAFDKDEQNNISLEFNDIKLNLFE